MPPNWLQQNLDMQKSRVVIEFLTFDFNPLSGIRIGSDGHLTGATLQGLQILRRTHELRAIQGHTRHGSTTLSLTLGNRLDVANQARGNLHNSHAALDVHSCTLLFR